MLQHLCGISPLTFYSSRWSFALSGCQGRSDGGIWVYVPPKSVQVEFLWGKNDVSTAIEHGY